MIVQTQSFPAEHCPEHHTSSTGCHLLTVFPGGIASLYGTHLHSRKKTGLIKPGYLLPLLQGPVRTLLCPL